MTVQDMLELCTDLYNVHICVYDCLSEQVIFDSDKLDRDDCPVMELYGSDIGNHEVCSYDLYLHNGIINLEFNIDYEPEDEE